MWNSNNVEVQWLNTLRYVKEEGEERPDRTKTGIWSVFAPPPLSAQNVAEENSFPLFTSKRVPFKSVVAETLWFLQGRTDLASLRADGCTWWDEWELEDGTIGPGYGHQFRNFGGVDQLSQTIEQIKTDPFSRRHVMTLWNVPDLPQMALVPCHGVMIQFYVDSYQRLSLLVHIRSSDMFLGLPTNIPSYAVVLMMVAQVTGLLPGDLKVSLGDAHIYTNHEKAVEEVLTREPTQLPTLRIDPTVKDIDEFRPEHFTLVDYSPQPTIKAPVAV